MGTDHGKKKKENLKRLVSAGRAAEKPSVRGQWCVYDTRESQMHLEGQKRENGCKNLQVMTTLKGVGVARKNPVMDKRESRTRTIGN